MSISRFAQARTRTRGDEAASYILPSTVSCAALLDKGSDRQFRGLVNDLFTIASRMEIVRAHLGGRMGISGPQYSVLIAVAHLQGERGVRVGTLAQALHVVGFWKFYNTVHDSLHIPVESTLLGDTGYVDL